jgi:hypothetical protein
LIYVKQPGTFTTPLVGVSQGELGLVTQVYVSGTDIVGAAATQHIGLFEIGATGLIVKFIDITLVDTNIAEPAPMIINPVVAQGSVVGATKITYASSNLLRYVIQDTVVATPLVGDDVSGIGTAYTSGADITGVLADKHIGLFEVDTNGKVVKFIDIKLASGDIAQ